MSCTNNDASNAMINHSFSGFEGETDNVRGGGEGDEEEEDEDDENYMEGEHSSATTTKGSSKKGKMDRSRTLISERKRRGRMKEKLYALRALVPNITKVCIFNVL